MSFEIQIVPLGHFELVQLIDTSSNTVIEIATKGALLNSWQVRGHSTSLDIVEGNDFSMGWVDFEAGGFKGGKMSPFSCRIENGQYTFEDKAYTIEKFYHEKHALHGILYDALFSIELSETDEQGAYLHLQCHYKATDKGFPFEYTVLIKWHLHKNNLVTAETIVTNLSDSTIPMMDGWHPYFKLDASINDTFIQLEANGKIEYDEKLLPTGKILDENEFVISRKIGTLHLDNCYLVDASSNTCVLENEKYQLIVQPLMNYPYLQLYTPADRKSIAIENLSGIPNCFNNKIGLQLMKPHQNLVLKTSYQFIIKQLPL